MNDQWLSRAILAVTANLGVSNCDPGDSRALLEFKAGLTDPRGVFSSWQDGTNCCTWSGVNCTSSGRVQGLQTFAPFPTRGPDPQRDPNYGGVLGESLGNLTELVTLNLDYILFNGPMPNSFNRLKKLEDLSLFLNNFTGSLSPSLGGATSLKNLHIDIYGPTQVDAGVIPAPIPPSFCALVNLQIFTLRFKATGTIPPCFCQFTQLTLINLNANNLVNEIPSCIGNSLTKLEELDLGSNRFRGSIPHSLSGLITLQRLSLDNNKFSGSIPQQIGDNLVNLVRLNLGSNMLSGPIPSSIGRLTKLEVLDLSFNFLTRVPPELGNLINVTNLFLNSNRLQATLPPELVNTGSGAQFGFFFNISNNNLRGTVPDVCSKGIFRSFFAANNFFTGGFPLSLALCDSVDLSNNLLSDSGQIGTLATDPPLHELRLGNNRFPAGPVPGWLTSLLSAGSQTLQFIDISSNKFTGAVPDIFFNLPSVQRLNISHNGFNSMLPTTVIIGQSARLDLSYNQIFGQITPTLLDSLIQAAYLDFSFNVLSGPLPPSSGDFQSLFYLDLSDNQLNGTVPAYIEAIPNLIFLDLSNNQFTGNVPSKSPPPGEGLPP
ncbi:hypothetical protein R1flu_013274 [Riccia fluitans]|uniref:Leucine-rich repeat-containing N-terminal plant-type domain-containing protein n=1 Tax=Riccia fluitans TaxID=41844 RepID=A0ABD1YCY0_9MARC